MKVFISLFFVVLCTAAWCQYTIHQVPDPKENPVINEDSKDPSEFIDGYISNPDNIIGVADEYLINLMLADLEANHSFQVAVVAVNSIGDDVPKDFAVDLFEHWGVGNADKNDGLLVLFVLDQRRIEFETGYGTSTILPDTRCVAIQQEYMLPHFKNVEYSTGIKRGVEAIVSALEGQTIVDTYEVSGMTTEELALKAEIRRDETIQEWVIGLSVWHAIGLILFLIALVIAQFRHDPYSKYNTVRWFHLWIWAFIFPITHIFVVLLAKKLKQRYRDMIRFSGKTGDIMRKMTEADEDECLSRGQITEELIRSIDYDVWVTDSSTDLLILPYKRLFSGYSSCPKCKFKTYHKEYDRTISSPTYSSRGMGERKHACKNCGHSVKKRYSIAKLVKASTTSSSSGWSSSSSGGGYSSGSSGGGSWGGGSSGGGGGGSSW